MPRVLFLVLGLPLIHQFLGIDFLAENARAEALGDVARTLLVEILQVSVVALVGVQKPFLVRPCRIGRRPPAEKIKSAPFRVSPEHHDGLHRALIAGIILDGDLTGLRVHVDHYGNLLPHVLCIGISVPALYM